MAEEFLESDIIFADHDPRQFTSHDDDSSFHYSEMLLAARRNSWALRKQKSRKKKNRDLANSLPVKIPESVFPYTSDTDALEEEWDSEGIVPPHVIIGRRVAGKMAFSVCTGNGRTLKGRDLSQVRNSILRMTGFLET